MIKFEELNMKKMSEEIVVQNGDGLYQRVSTIIENARNTVYNTANKETVQAYWNIGREIVEEEQHGKSRAEYGKALLEGLAVKLTKKYGKSFSNRNLRYMRQFYRFFENWNAVRSELSWTHYRYLMKVENKNAREYYVNEAIECRWSSRQLQRQIHTLYYERILASKDKALIKAESEEKKEIQQAKDFIKDPVVLEFLKLQPQTDYYEKDIEQLLIDKLQHFLLELGKGFCFVSRQYHISADTKHYHVDLVFYNYILKCFLLIDLKTTELDHSDVGQMDFYVGYFEKEVRQENDNPTIGLILCAEKNKTIAKYSLLNDSKQIFASQYQTYLPTKQQLEEELQREKEQIEQEKELQNPESDE